VGHSNFVGCVVAFEFRGWCDGIQFYEGVFQSCEVCVWHSCGCVAFQSCAVADFNLMSVCGFQSCVGVWIPIL
jgi:hypothetical protein